MPAPSVIHASSQTAESSDRMIAHDRRALPREGRVYKVRPKSASDRQMTFYVVSQCHQLTQVQQDAIREICRRDMAIGEMRTLYASRDWWDSQGPRMRLRAPWRIVKVRLQNAMVRASFSVNRLRSWS